MEKFFKTSSIVDLPLELPEAAVWSRLGRNRFLSNISSAEEQKLKLAMHRALVCCRPRGRWRLLKISAIDQQRVLLGDDWMIESTAFASFAAQGNYLLLGAVTAGGKIADLINKTALLADQAVFDAVGSECADQAIGNLFRIAAVELQRFSLRVIERRFSPGYGGVELAVQRRIFELLELGALGMTLTDSCIMQPEKSVTAFAPVLSVN